MSGRQDLVVIGGGVIGSTVALLAARAGMAVTLLERDALARGASGTNAGTLTLQMTRVALIPYAMKAHAMWASACDWLGHDVGVVVCDGLSLAFTEGEEEMLAFRAGKRREAGAPIALVSAEEARRIEPGLTDRLRMAAHCTVDGFANAYLTGLAFRAALVEAGVDLREHCPADDVQPAGTGYSIRTKAGTVATSRVVLAGGVWLEPMARWFGIDLPIRTLTNQLAVTERAEPVMRTVVGIASGLLSLKQYPHGTVVIGGGWQGVGDREANTHRVDPESLVGNVRLAQYAIPALANSRIVRAWTGFEAETADAMPVAGPLPGHPGAWICGSVHSGYTSGPYVAQCLVQAMLGEEPEMPLFPVDRLLKPAATPAPAASAPKISASEDIPA